MGGRAKHPYMWDKSYRGEHVLEVEFWPGDAENKVYSRFELDAVGKAHRPLWLGRRLPDFRGTPVELYGLCVKIRRPFSIWA